MKTPFTLEQFLNVFSQYNTTVWPMQVLLYLLATTIIYLIIRKKNYGDKVISGILAFFWFWMGIVYHLLFFSVINKAAFGFGALFIVQGALFLYYGVFKSVLTFKQRKDASGITGMLFIFYALIIYPVLGFTLGHVYPAAPTFGLPCPTTIFTLSLLLFTDRKIPIILVIIPLVWSMIGFMAALNFGILEDIGLIITGIVVSTMLFTRFAGKTIQN